MEGFLQLRLRIIGEYWHHNHQNEHLHIFSMDIRRILSLESSKYAPTYLSYKVHFRYILFSHSVLFCLPLQVLGSAAVAVTFAERLFGWFAISIPLFVAASTFGAVNGVLLTSSRYVNIKHLFNVGQDMCNLRLHRKRA